MLNKIIYSAVLAGCAFANYTVKVEDFKEFTFTQKIDHDEKATVTGTFD